MELWGLTIRVNPLFLLVVFLFLLVGMIEEVLIAFSLVLLHELAHILVAISSGFKVNKIEIFPFGGLAEYSGLLEMEPWKEIKVSLAGPLFNLIFALIIHLLIYANIINPAPYIDLIIAYNLVIASVNLIPALPLDGGRVLRALLVHVCGINKGNKIALRIAKHLALLGIIIGILILVFNKTDLWFLFFFFFVYGMINKEEKQLFYYFLQYLSKKNKENSNLRIKELTGQVVRDNLSVKDAVYYINPVKYNLYFVLNDQFNIVGIISEANLLQSYFSQKDKTLVMKDII